MGDVLKPLFSWRAAVAESTLSPTHRHVALALSLYMSERGDSAHPGPARLASDTGLHLSTVKEKLADLERAGWLRCISRGGLRGAKKCANEYVTSVPEPELFETAPVAVGDPSPATTGSPERGDPSPSPRAPVAVGDPISPKNSPENSPSTRGGAFDADFVEWYAGYPRHVDRKDALGAYRARRRQGVAPERLTAARDHYAKAVDGQDIRYVKYPSTFLAKDGPWTEWEHGPPVGANPKAPSPLGAVRAVVGGAK